MKVRIEIFEDDGTEKANAQFNGEHWKEQVTNFINFIDDTKPPSTVPSSEIPTPHIVQPPVQPPVQTPVQPPVQTPVQPPVQTPVQPPVQTPVQPPVQTPVQTPMQIPVQPPVQTPIQTPIQTPVQTPMQIPAPQNPQLQPYTYPYPYPPIQQPFYYYPQPVQYQPQPNTPPQVNHHPLQQAVFPTNQPPQPQQYAAQPVAILQSQPQAQVQPQTRQSHVPLRDKINDTTLTISERLELFLKYEYPHVWFTSQEIQGHYERVYGFIKLSTVSTYLSRMYRKDLLQRRGNRTQREYMYICDELDIPHTDGITASEANGIMQ